MDENYLRETVPEKGEKPMSCSAVPAAEPQDSVTRFINRNMDFDSLAGDIKELVTERLQSSMPDDRRIILDLVNQMGELTEEVKRLRQQIDTNAREAYDLPNRQMTEMSAEISEIKQLLTQKPALTELEEEPEETSAPQQSAKKAKPQKEKKKKGAASIIGNILFYAFIVGIVFGTFLFKSGSGGQPTMIAGYSAFTVLTSSMEDVYPKGSLIVTKHVDDSELKIGDDITYMISESSSITHRIVGITENYLDTGERGFETQGTMNEKPDKDPVAAANVVGQVIFCSVALGKMAGFVNDNWPILIFAAVIICALVAFLKWNFRRDEAAEGQEKPPKKKK